jgi:hypothetical protein
MAAAEKKFVEQWRPASDAQKEEEEKAAYSAALAPLAWQANNVVEEKVVIAFLSGDLTSRAM